MNGTIEHLEPLFLETSFAEKTKQLRGQKIYRVNIGVGRHYRLESGDTFKSLTTFLDAVMPKNKFLDKWRNNLIEELGSVEKVDEFVDATADYGTALHIAVADYCRNSGVNWAEFDSWAFNYLIGMGLTNTVSQAHAELTKDFASLLQFFHDYRVDVIAVEIPVWIKDGVATLIDLVVEMDAKNYEKTPIEKRERITSIINLKSGKKGFFETHVFQLYGEWQMFDNVYGNQVSVTKVFNLAPSDWKTKPSYKLKDQTTEITSNNVDQQFQLLLKLGALRGVLSAPSKEFTVFLGNTKFGESPVEAMAKMSYDQMADKKLLLFEQSKEII